MRKKSTASRSLCSGCAQTRRRAPSSDAGIAEQAERLATLRSTSREHQCDMRAKSAPVRLAMSTSQLTVWWCTNLVRAMRAGAMYGDYSSPVFK